MSKYDEVLKPFVSLMERELYANSGKGDRPGWLAMSAYDCMLEIYYHAAKLQKAVKDGNGDGIAEYSADVANMAMMVADICGAIHLIAPAVERQEPVAYRCRNPIDFIYADRQKWEPITLELGRVYLERKEVAEQNPDSQFSEYVTYRALEIEPLYTSPPGPVAVVLPGSYVIPPKTNPLQDDDIFDFEKGWNACLDKVKELNQ